MLRDVPQSFSSPLLSPFMLATSGGTSFNGADLSVAHGGVNAVMESVVDRYDTLEVKFTHSTTFTATTRVELRFPNNNQEDTYRRHEHGPGITQLKPTEYLCQKTYQNRQLH